MSAYESRKKHVSKTETSEYKYPCIHSTPQSGTRFYYSKINNNGHFGIKKVILGETGIYNAINDMNGKYGMTQQAMAIQYDNNDGILIKQAIESDKFKELINACSWSNYSIDCRMFNYFKKDFWKAFIN